MPTKVTIPSFTGLHIGIRSPEKPGDSHSFVFKGFNGIFTVNSGFPSMEIRTYNQDESQVGQISPSGSLK